MTSGPSRPRVSRRGVLAGVAGLVTAPTSPSVGETARLSVLTWNCYLGVDLFRLRGATTPEQVRRVAGELLNEAVSHPYGRRARRIAAEIADARPTVVALQEVVSLTTQARSGDTPDRSEEGTTVVDFLDLLRSALADQDPSYEVAVVTPTTTVRVPADSETGTVDLHLTDRDVILVRQDVRVEEVRSDIFDARLAVFMAGETARVTRGFSVVDIIVQGIPVTVSTTHLESASGAVRRQQARELLDRLPTDRPVVLAGDFNAGPDTNPKTYELLLGSLRDVVSAGAGSAAGPTCCQPPHLRTAESSLTARVDTVLYRGRIRANSAERIAADPADRITHVVDDGEVRQWPSDHAGVLATLTLRAAKSTPGRTGTPSSASTTTSTPIEPTEPDRTDRRTGETTGDAMDGFGPVAAVVSLVVALAAGATMMRDP